MKRSLDKQKEGGSIKTLFLLILLLTSMEGGKVYLLANEIDKSLANDLISDLSENFNLVLLGPDDKIPDDFRILVILGGPDAPGVGKYSSIYLSGEEEEELRRGNTKGIYLKRYEDRLVIVVAGSNRYLTREAHVENRVEIIEEVSGALSETVESEIDVRVISHTSNCSQVEEKTKWKLMGKKLIVKSYFHTPTPCYRVSEVKAYQEADKVEIEVFLTPKEGYCVMCIGGNELILEAHPIGEVREVSLKIHGAIKRSD